MTLFQHGSLITIVADLVIFAAVALLNSDKAKKSLVLLFTIAVPLLQYFICNEATAE